MSLYKRKDSRHWWASITKPGGGTVCRSTGTEDRKQAQEWYDRMRAEMWRVNRLGDKPSYRWEDAVVRWCADKQDKKTIAEDIDKFRWLHKHLSGRELASISRAQIVAIGDAKRAETSAPTANRYLALIRAVLRRAAGPWEWIDKAPYIESFPESRRRVRWITPEQRQALLAALREHQRVCVEFALETGLRQGNVVRLEWSQVDLERRTCWIFADQAKGGSPIGVPLSARAVEVLAGERGKHATRVFTYRGRPFAELNTKSWKKALRVAGLDNFRWHDLRHAWASAHAMSGTRLSELQELGGWKSEAMVRRYAHFAPDHLRRAADNTATFWLRSGKSESQNIPQDVDSMGWLMGLEPTTTGITIRDSTN